MWATAYLRDTLFVCLRTTSSCEGVNYCLKIYVKRKNSIVKLLYNLLLDFNSFYTEPYINTSVLMFKRDATKLYTQDVYDLVKKQIVNDRGMIVINRCQVGDNVTFKVDKFSE
ncbi:hypothetical protein GmHk_20G058107 [Glycine max]|nr:hypothetical protein GmHk_20G058107 [Glycine max]